MHASGQILPHAVGWMTLTFARDDYSAVAADLEVSPGRWSFWRLYISLGHLVGRDLILKLGW